MAVIFDYMSMGANVRVHNDAVEGLSPKEIADRWRQVDEAILRINYNAWRKEQDEQRLHSKGREGE